MEKQFKKHKVKENKTRGITLIALVITIIVLLILAGVSISMLAGDNSILRNATEAKSKTEYAKAQEEVALAYAEAVGKYYTSNAGTVDLESEVIGALKDAGYTIENVTTGTVTGITVEGSTETLSINMNENNSTGQNFTIGFSSSSGTAYYVLADGKYYLLTITDTTATLSTEGLSQKPTGSTANVANITATATTNSSAVNLTYNNGILTVKTNSVTDDTRVTIQLSYNGISSNYIELTVNSTAQTYTIATNISKGTSSGSSSIKSNSTATVNLSANTNYVLPSSITVTGATYSYNSSTGIVTLSQPTENVTITVVCEVETITDLTDTEWYFNRSLVFEEYCTYNINFNSENPSGEMVSYDKLIWSRSGPDGPYLCYGDSALERYGSRPDTWTFEACRTIYITGGEDATNTELIAWLQANATLQ